MAAELTGVLFPILVESSANALTTFSDIKANRRAISTLTALTIPANSNDLAAGIFGDKDVVVLAADPIAEEALTAVAADPLVELVAGSLVALPSDCALQPG